MESPSSFENIAYIQAAAEQLPFKPGKFNRVICFACFPHFENKPVAAIEIARTLTQDGILVIAHAASRGKINAMHTSIGGVLSHDVIPTNSEMYHLLEQSGFSKIRISDEIDFYLVLAEKEMNN
jgi:ubiquinone/menaquinone biosynthesis C-methylase UbiE